MVEVGLRLRLIRAGLSVPAFSRPADGGAAVGGFLCRGVPVPGHVLPLTSALCNYSAVGFRLDTIIKPVRYATVFLIPFPTPSRSRLIPSANPCIIKGSQVTYSLVTYTHIFGDCYSFIQNRNWLIWLMLTAWYNYTSTSTGLQGSREDMEVSGRLGSGIAGAGLRDLRGCPSSLTGNRVVNR